MCASRLPARTSSHSRTHHSTRCSRIILSAISMSGRGPCELRRVLRQGARGWCARYGLERRDPGARDTIAALSEGARSRGSSTVVRARTTPATSAACCSKRASVASRATPLSASTGRPNGLAWPPATWRHAYACPRSGNRSSPKAGPTSTRRGDVRRAPRLGPAAGCVSGRIAVLRHRLGPRSATAWAGSATRGADLVRGGAGCTG
jgi:hypothetical protein